MQNLVEVKYHQTGASAKINEFGMREMQERAYNARDAQYLLLKATIDATDKAIDQMVYELYGLTDDEIKIVEGE